jgi:hypothetical protein
MTSLLIEGRWGLTNSSFSIFSPNSRTNLKNPLTTFLMLSKFWVRKKTMSNVEILTDKELSRNLAASGSLLIGGSHHA